jgi:hypothetical protein
VTYAPHRERYVVTTTPQLRLDVKEIDQLIATLRRTYGRQAEELEDLRWLRNRRHYILALLASRRAQSGRKVVRLDSWRDGGAQMRLATRSVA